MIPPDPSPPDIILFTFDDGLVSTYAEAFPVLDAAGIMGTVYINSSTIGTDGYLTEEQLIDLDAAGWDVGNHTATHQKLGLLATQAEQEAEIAACRDYLDGLGLTRASHHLAFPNGSFNGDTRAACIATGMLTGRGYLKQSQTIPFDPLNFNGAIDLYEGLSLDVVKAQTITTELKRLTVYVYHTMWPDGAEQFAEIVAWAKSLNVPIVTISQLYDYVQNGYSW